jgi:ABC-2 type transport system permease protein
MKEIKSYYRSPLAYFVTGLFLLIVGWMFFSHLSFFIENVQKAPVHMRHSYDFANEVIIKVFGNINFLFLFITPVLCMRSFSEEYKNKTIDLYYSSPISYFELILGKTLTVLTQGFILILLTLIYPLILSNLNIGDSSFLFTGYLGLALNYASYCCVGILASSLSSSPVIAVLVGFVFNLFLWMMGWFSTLTSNYLVAEILKFLSINVHYQNFVSGVISFSDISFYFSLFSITFLLIHKRLEARFWL